MLRSPLLLVAFVVAGCAAKTAPAPSSPESPSAVNAAESPSAPSAAVTPPATGSAPSTAPSAAGTSPDAAPPPGEPPPGTPTLPAVSVKTIGLHVGGGPNDAAGKAPFVTALEQRFPEFLRCYRLVSEPGKGGSFGVDLHIERKGGHARVEQPRSALEGEPFRACMVSAFEGVEFPQLKKPFVISYSLRFLIEQ
jgi:hypothetical protein